jgi:hypothetical protein
MRRRLVLAMAAIVAIPISTAGAVTLPAGFADEAVSTTRSTPSTAARRTPPTRRSIAAVAAPAPTTRRATSTC